MLAFGILLVPSWNRISQNGDRTILFHRELVRSNKANQEIDLHNLSDYWKCHRPLGTLVFDPGSAELFKTQETIYFFDKYYVGKCQNLQKSKVFGKKRVPNNPWDWSYQFLKILNMGSMSFKKHEITHPPALFRFPLLHQRTQDNMGALWNHSFVITWVATQ